MTGEITLRGRVLAIGGLKEKILAAHRAGIRTVIMPRENVKDLQDLPKRVLKGIRLVPVAHMDEVLREALALADPGEFLKQPSVPVDWRVPVERRAIDPSGAIRHSRFRSPVRCRPAAPTPSNVPGPSTAVETVVVPLGPEDPSPGGDEH